MGIISKPTNLSTEANLMYEILKYISRIKISGGGGGGSVNSVTGTLVTGTATNPIVNIPTFQQVTDEGAVTTNMVTFGDSGTGLYSELQDYGLSCYDVNNSAFSQFLFSGVYLVDTSTNAGVNIYATGISLQTGGFFWVFFNCDNNVAIYSVQYPINAADSIVTAAMLEDLNIIERGVFSGEFALTSAIGGEYTPLTQTGALTLSIGAGAVNGGIDSAKITANGSAITVPGSWINVGSDTISIVNGAVNRIVVRRYQGEIWYSVKVI